jgi:hypothetical protein
LVVKDRTVADWVAEGETTMALFNVALECGHDAILTLADLPPGMASDASGRRGARSAEPAAPR